jgi:hypothetical protein
MKLPHDLDPRIVAVARIVNQTLTLELGKPQHDGAIQALNQAVAEAAKRLIATGETEEQAVGKVLPATLNILTFAVRQSILNAIQNRAAAYLQVVNNPFRAEMKRQFTPRRDARRW